MQRDSIQKNDEEDCGVSRCYEGMNNMNGVNDINIFFVRKFQLTGASALKVEVCQVDLG